MPNENEIKAKAKRKLDIFVKGELQYLVDNHLSIDKFSLENMLLNYISDQEGEKIRESLKLLQQKKVIAYCNINGIDIPESLKKS